MNELEKDLILAVNSGDLSENEFWQKFAAVRPYQTAVSDLLSEAIEDSDADAVECALLFGLKFGFDDKTLDLLSSLAYADWHHSHEDIVSILSKFGERAPLHALEHAATHVPAYLGFDDSRVLAVKAVWAISKRSDREAQELLKGLSLAKDPIVASCAIRRLQEKCID